MSLDGLFALGSAIVVLAVVATAVQSPHTANIINAMGSSFGESIRAARGN